MGISIFPSTAAEFVSNNFVVDMNDTLNNTADTGGVKQAGPYSMSFSSGDSSFDVYLIDEDGNSVGYSNNTSIVASGLFSTVVILGVSQDEIISFLYQGSVNNADGEGDEPGAGAYLESISPSDLPTIDDTATVIGGNFGADTEITFESGATVLPAKSITVVSGTELLVTRPDGLVEDDSPYNLKAINTGVTPPSSVDFVLTDAVTAGSDPTWVTTSPLNVAVQNEPFSQTLEATDAEGTIVSYTLTAGSLPTGLSLNTSTGEISGTATTIESQTFTITVEDDGGNTTAKQFEQSVALASGGAVTFDGGFAYHTFTSTDDFVAPNSISNVEYLVVAGGGGGGAGVADESGGGGAGGLLSGTAASVSGTVAMVVGAGGAVDTQGNDTTFTGIATAIGGGFGGEEGTSNAGGDGGSGGGAAAAGGFAQSYSGGSGTAGQGNDGGDKVDGEVGSGGGGGAGQAGQDGDGSSTEGSGGNGLQFSAFATASGINVDGGYFAGGGQGSNVGVTGASPGLGGGGVSGDDLLTRNSTAGTPNTGGGGGGGTPRSPGFPGSPGGSGVVIVRYAI